MDFDVIGCKAANWHCSGSRVAWSDDFLQRKKRNNFGQLKNKHTNFGIHLVKSFVQVPASAKGRFALFVAPDTFQIRCPEMRQAGFLCWQVDWIWHEMIP